MFSPECKLSAAVSNKIKLFAETKTVSGNLILNNGNTRNLQIYTAVASSDTQEEQKVGNKEF